MFEQPGQPQPRQEHRNVLMPSGAAAYAMASQCWSSGRSNLQLKIEFLVVLLLAALTDLVCDWPNSIDSLSFIVSQPNSSLPFSTTRRQKFERGD